MYGAGWQNRTPYELSFLREIKTRMLEKYGIDLDKMKPFGPRQSDGFCRGGLNPAQPGGVDAAWDEDELLRFANGWSYRLEELCVGLYYHLEWR